MSLDRSHRNIQASTVVCLHRPTPYLYFLAGKRSVPKCLQTSYKQSQNNPYAGGR